MGAIRDTLLGYKHQKTENLFKTLEDKVLKNEASEKKFSFNVDIVSSTKLLLLINIIFVCPLKWNYVTCELKRHLSFFYRYAKPEMIYSKLQANKMNIIWRSILEFKLDKVVYDYENNINKGRGRDTNRN